MQIGQILNRFPDGHLVTIYNKGYCLTDVQLGLRNPNVGKNYYYHTSDESKCWKLQYVKKDVSSIPVLSIMKFPSPEDAQWDGFIDSVKKAVKYSTIIIDLRKNHRGNDAIGYDLIASLNGGAITPVVDYFISKQTPAAYALLANSFFIQMQIYASKKEEMPSYLINNYSTFVKQFNQAIEKKIPTEDTIYFNKKETKGKSFLKKKYSGNIYVLADAACGSSGETVLEGLKTLSNVIFVGENTAGVVHSRNNGIVVLPISKVKVQIGTRYVKYIDNRFIEKVGYKPDVSVPSGTDALEYVLKLII